MPPWILSIDDGLDLPASVSDRLREADCELRQTADPEEAMQWVHAERPAMVLLEIESSHYDGLDLMAGIREVDAGAIPVLVLTQLSRDSAEHGEAIALGCVDFLTKPAAASAVLSLVKDTLPELAIEAAGRSRRPEADLEGDLEDVPVPELLARLRRRTDTGVLGLRRGRRRVAVQVRRGVPIGLRMRARRNPTKPLFEAFGWEEGEYHFYRGRGLEPRTLRKFDVDPVALLADGVLDAAPLRRVRDRLAKRGSLYVSLAEDAPTTLGRWSLSEKQQRALEALSGEDTLAVLLDSVVFDDREIYALWVSGTIELRTTPTLTLTALLGTEATPEPEALASQQEALEELQRTRDESERELAALARDREAREAEIQQLARDREARLNELDELARTRFEYERERDALAPALEEQAAELERLERARERRTRELESLAAARERHEEELAELAAARQERARQHNAMVPALEECAQELEALEEARTARARELEALARTRDEHERAIEELAQTREDHVRELEALAPALEERAREIDALAKVREEHEQELEELAVARAEHADELEHLARAVADRAQELEGLARARAERAQELEELTRTRAQETRELEALRRVRQELEREMDALARTAVDDAPTLEAVVPSAPALDALESEADTQSMAAASDEDTATMVVAAAVAQAKPEPVSEPESEPEPDVAPEIDVDLDAEDPSEPALRDDAPALVAEAPVPEPAQTEPLDRENLVVTMRELAQRLLSSDDFEVLGVGPDSSDSEVRAAHRARLDEVPEVESTTANLVLCQQADRIRVRIRAAFDNLGNAEKRRAYAMLRDEEAEDRRAQSSAERVLEGERWFRKGETHLDAKQYDQATEAFGMASHLDPEQGDYVAHLGYALYLTNPSDAVVQREALENVAKGIKLSSDQPLPYVFLGRIHKAKGEVEVAKKIFSKALLLKPDFRPAIQELRVIEMRERKGKGKGVLSRLMGG
ncbi:MAG: response regulator [Myxococcota bacterium]